VPGTSISAQRSPRDCNEASTFRTASRRPTFLPSEAYGQRQKPPLEILRWASPTVPAANLKKAGAYHRPNANVLYRRENADRREGLFITLIYNHVLVRITSGELACTSVPYHICTAQLVSPAYVSQRSCRQGKQPPTVKRYNNLPESADSFASCCSQKRMQTRV